MSYSKALITPLNWGLGHATRCIPIIKALQYLNIEMAIAGDGDSLRLLKREFPSLEVFELPSLEMNYHGKDMVWSMLRQSTKLLKSILQEHREIEKIVKKEKIDLVISDNRFGCYSTKAKSVFISHQLNIIAPKKVLEKPVNLVNHALMANFEEIWVPDYKGEFNLSGRLSRPVSSQKVKYIGALSRMKFAQESKDYDVIAVLSGPEPQRTIFERMIFAQAIKLRDKKFLIVRGQPERWEFFNLTDNVEVVSFLTTKALNSAINRSEMFLGRSGYTTVMDLCKLGKKAVLIPTPGQTEQEYLAEKLAQEGVLYTQEQENFNLAQSLIEVEEYAGWERKAYPEQDLSSLLSSIL